MSTLAPEYSRGHLKGATGLRTALWGGGTSGRQGFNFEVLSGISFREMSSCNRETSKLESRTNPKIWIESFHFLKA